MNKLFKCYITLRVLLISSGIIICGYFIKDGIVHFRCGERTVTIKGISERQVSSDLAVWNLYFTNAGSDLAQINEKKTRITR